MNKKMTFGICTVLLIATMVTSLVPLMPVAAAVDPACGFHCGVNIVTNGGFESPVVGDSVPNGWNIYHTIPGWTVAWMPAVPSTFTYNLVDYAKPSHAYFELQTDVPSTEIPGNWKAAEGHQWTELDSDWFGIPMEGSGAGASVVISQVLSTIPCQTYTLTFAFSPRPGHADNQMQVTWGGHVVTTVTGTGSSGTVWTYYTFQVKATSWHMKLSFSEVGAADSMGSFLDAVSVSIPCPTGGGGD